MTDQKERVLAAFEKREGGTHEQIVEFAFEVEFGDDDSALIASHMLLMVDSDRRHAQGEHGCSIADKCDRMVRKVNTIYQGDDFSADAAESAKEALMQAYDPNALYAFVSCFPAKALQIFGI